MTFENSIWLTLTPLLVLSIAGMVAFGLRRREALLSKFVAVRLLNQLTEKASLRRVLIKASLLLLACTLIGIALARPQYGVEFVERKARGLDIVFVLDSSRSMWATDIKPSRLERAKLAIIDLVKRLESDRIGLVAFAGSAFLQTPPTLDYSAFCENLNAIGPGIISRGGSNIGQALSEAVKAFPKDNNVKVVILLTDGEDLEAQAINTASKIAKEGIKVYSIGIGTPQGTYLKVLTDNGDEEFIRDSFGQPVRSQLDEATLQKIAQLTGGSYRRLADQSLDTLYASVLANLPREERESELQETRIERYQWVLLAALVCLIFEILIPRRRKTSVQLATTLVLVSLFSPTPSIANEEVDSHFEEPGGDIVEKAITDPRILYNQAHAHLLKGDYLTAQTDYEKALEQSDDLKLKRDALYNLAHVNSQLGETALQEQNYETAIENWKKAEALFQSVTEIDSTDTAGQEDEKKLKTRRKALEEFLQNQQSQEQQSQSSSNDDDQNQQNPESKSAETEQNQKSESSSDDSSSKDESTSSDNASEKSSSEKQENSSAGNSSDDESSASDMEQNDSGSSDQDEQTDVDNNTTDEESTADPVEDIQQGNKETSKNESKETESDSKAESGTVGGEGSEPSKGSVFEGMRISEAQALLDSLRNDEHLLPFTEEKSNTAGRKGETRNW